jgi:hypothetical protein
VTIVAVVKIKRRKKEKAIDRVTAIIKPRVSIAKREGKEREEQYCYIDLIQSIQFNRINVLSSF